MLYFKTVDGRRIIMLEPRSLDMLKQGLPCETPDKSAIVVYTPDIEWTFGEIQKLLGAWTGPRKALLPNELDAILKQGMQRTPVVRTVEEMRRIRIFGPSLKGKRK